MNNKYFPPTFGASRFHCALCSVFAAQTWNKVYVHINAFKETLFSASYCAHCSNPCYWYQEQMVVPSMAPVEMPHPDLPEDCRKDFEEARDIFSRSPRASAALLRLCVQKLLPHLGQPGKNINDDIGALVASGLPLQVQQALDYCRVVGNHAVHPGEIDLEDTPEIAQQLFAMINFIVDNRITQPREVQRLYERLPESARSAVGRRDGGS
jgi:hypothetical protein